MRIVTVAAIIYENPVMLPAISEPVVLPAGQAVRVDKVRQGEGEPVPARFMHFHGPAELVLVEQGSGRFLSEGGAYDFGPGDILYAPSMAIHDFAFHAGPRAWTLVQFDPPPSWALPPLPPGAGAARPGAPALERFRSLAGWIAECQPGDAPSADVAMLLPALLLVMRDALRSLPPAPGQAGSRLARFRPLLARMSERPGEMLTLAQAASFCGLSPEYFSRSFKAAVGTGFIAYQMRWKLQLAARTLASGDTQVSQVAYGLGFGSHAYFSHCYRAMFGVAPSRHRNRRGQ